MAMFPCSQCYFGSWAEIRQEPTPEWVTPEWVLVVVLLVLVVVLVVLVVAF